MHTVETVFKAAVFVDAENQTELDIANLLQSLAPLEVVEKHAYADWRNCRLTFNAQALDQHGFKLHHVPSGEVLGAQKDKADQYMARAVRALLRQHPEIKVVILVTGDHYFTSLVRELQRWGKQVYIAATPMSMSKELYAAAQNYIPLGRMAAWIRQLNKLEKRSRYLTFKYTVQKSKLSPDALQRLINCGVLQKHRDSGGSFREILVLNRQAHAVRVVLSA